MARLTDTEEAQWREAARKRASAPAPRPRRMTAKEYLEFATFAAAFTRGRKPVKFSGDRWRL